MKLNIHGRTYTLRPCTNKDYPFVYRISKANMAGYFTKHLGGWHPEKFRENFRKENIMIVEYNARRVGFIDLDTRNGHTYVSNIQLSTEVRGKGLGTALVKFMERKTKQKKTQQDQAARLQRKPRQETLHTAWIQKSRR